MKKLLFVLAIALPFIFASCSNDEDDDTLEGTVWENSETDGRYNFVQTFYFEKSTFRYVMIDQEDTNGDGIYDKEDKEEGKGTYTCKDSKVTLTMDGQTITATISGNKMTSEPDEDGDVSVLYKK